MARALRAGVCAPVSVYFFSRNDKDDNLVLCLDEGCGDFNTDGQGEPLFSAAGEPAAFLKKVLEFLKEYERQDRLTRVFCAELKRLELLTPMQARVSLLGDEKISLAGFLMVNRERLKALAGAELAALAQQNILELMFAHLTSLEQLSARVGRVTTLQNADQVLDAPAS